MNRIKRGWMAVILLSGLALGACVPTPSAPAATLPVQASPSAVPPAAASATPAATVPPAPSLTPAPTLSPTPSPTPTPPAAFDQARVLSITRNLSGVQIILIIDRLKSAYDITLDKKPYRCAREAAYPDRLVCQGLAMPLPDRPLALEIFPVGSLQPVYSTRLVIAPLFIPTDIPSGYAKYDCPDRGKNVVCEVECRVKPDGNPCVVASCTDACGPYFAVDSCPADLAQPFTFCDLSQYPELKRLYNLP